MDPSQPGTYKRCSTCKTSIPFGGEYYKCSVSTCNKKVTALFFCSVPCWDAHVPDARHRDAWAEKETAPSGPEPEASEPRARRVVAVAKPRTEPSAESEDETLPRDVLIVMSKLKNYIKAKSGMRTSDGVTEPLSDHLRLICTAAIRSAGANERSTVLARDIEAALRGETASE